MEAARGDTNNCEDLINSTPSVDWRGRPSNPIKHGGMKAAAFVLGTTTHYFVHSETVSLPPQYTPTSRISLNIYVVHQYLYIPFHFFFGRGLKRYVGRRGWYKNILLSS